MSWLEICLKMSRSIALTKWCAHVQNILSYPLRLCCLLSLDAYICLYNMYIYIYIVFLIWKKWKKVQRAQNVGLIHLMMQYDAHLVYVAIRMGLDHDLYFLFLRPWKRWKRCRWCHLREAVGLPDTWAEMAKLLSMRKPDQTQIWTLIE